MTFQETLNDLIAQIGCTNKELANAGSLGSGTISRYRSGSSEPGSESSQLRRLAGGLSILAAEKGLPYKKEDLEDRLSASLDDALFVEYGTYLANLHSLLDYLGIKSVELARYMHHDPSLISRILTGKRRPSSKKQFSNDVALYAVKRFGKTIDLPAFCAFLGCSPENVPDNNAMVEQIVKWLGTSKGEPSSNPVKEFLQKIDSFNLDNYIRVLSFPGEEIPVFDTTLAPTTEYRGITRMMKSEIDFIAATLTSPSMEDVFLYSDMPISDMVRHKDFGKKWMMGMALLLKKGLHLHILHSINRPLPEMMLGLESYIPMYMTGQISPYYLKTAQNEPFLHLLKVSGAAALSGEAIARHQAEGRYILTLKEQEIEYFREEANLLLSKATPLMQIFTESREKEFHAFLESVLNSPERRMVSGSLPLFTIPKELLARMLKRCAVRADLTDRIMSFHAWASGHARILLSQKKMELEVPLLSLKLFEKDPLHLSLSEIFVKETVPYTYEEYQEHMIKLRSMASAYDNLTLKENPTPTFRNITFTVIPGKGVLVSKDNSPTIHFLIQHPKMIEAFSSFAAPYIEI